MDLDKVRLVSIQGDLHTGKSNAAFFILRSYKGSRKIYLLGYPRQVDDFKILQKKQEIDKLKDSIIFVDEFSRFFPLKANHTNEYFLDLARMSWHRNNTLIFCSQLSQDVTKRMESFIDCFIFTRIEDLRTLKNGSRMKDMVMDCADIKRTTNSLDLGIGEYMEYSPTNEIGDNGIKKFPFQDIGKDWRESVTQSVASSNARDKTQNNPVSPNNYRISKATLQEIEKEISDLPNNLEEKNL